MPGEVERLSGKLGLDTTEFKAAIAAANRELRVLETGFKASAAALGDWTKDATGLELRAKSLTDQIEIQRAKVDALRAEHQRLAAEHGDGSRAAQDMQIKLNKETETLNKMTRELDDTEAALKDMAEETDDAAEEVEDLDEEQEEAAASAQKLKNNLVDMSGTMKGLKKVAATLVKSVLAIGAAAATAAIGLVSLTVGPASDLEETISKTEVVFGDAADQVLRFGETSATSLGLSQNAALGAAATYGNLLRAMGLTNQESADMSISLVQLASDLASFNNLDPTEVLEKLRAGLTGESEPLKTLGVNMNEARIQAKALELGLVQQGESLTAAAKAQAAYAIIMEDTTLAQGDFARTSEGLANQQRIFAANIENLRAKVGTAFLPVMNEIQAALNDLVGSDEFNKFLEEMVEWFEDAAQSVRPFLDAIVYLIRHLLGGNGLFTAFEDGSSILGGFFERMGMGEDAANKLANQIIGIARAIGDFVNGTLLPFLQKHGKTLLTLITSLAAGFAAFSIITTVVGWITGLIAVVSSLAGAFAAAGGGIAGIVAILGGPVTLVIAAVAAAIALLTAAWTNNWFGIRDAVKNVWEGFLKPAFQTLAEWLQVAIPAALQTLSNYWNNVLLPSIQLVWQFLSGTLFPLLRAIADFLSAVFGLAVRALAGFWQNVLLPALQGVWSFLDSKVFPIFRSIAEYIKEDFQPIVEGLSNFLKNNLKPAWEGIVTAIQKAVDWIQSLADKIRNLELPDWLTPGSPTPWEIGLLGINQAMAQLNRQLPEMARGLERVDRAGSLPSLLAGAGARGGSVQNDQFNFYAPVVIPGSATPGGLGQVLRSKRF